MHKSQLWSDLSFLVFVEFLEFLQDNSWLMNDTSVILETIWSMTIFLKYDKCHKCVVLQFSTYLKLWTQQFLLSLYLYERSDTKSSFYARSNLPIILITIAEESLLKLNRIFQLNDFSQFSKNFSSFRIFHKNPFNFCRFFRQIKVLNTIFLTISSKLLNFPL